MKTQLLKPILTVAFVILGFTNVSAQLFDFNSSKGGWNAEFQMASAELDSEDGNDVLKCLRTSNNATLALDPLVATIDAKTVRWIRIVLKNTTASTVLRIKAQSTASGNNTAQFNITANDVAFKSYAFELTSAGSAWQAAIDAGSTMEEVRLLFRAGYAAAEGNIFIDEIEFSATEPILPSTDTFSEYIQNPNFEDPDGIGFLSGGGGEYTLSLETSGSTRWC
ncbi:hypothetical protein JCM19274_148 [Algibacter lectus]|uniref:Uncharacterized protein n=1 Tax=Algibacter lectus TaxID=221126 RepID=A0A090X0C2_9FLAO|nr:hypothetical protein [Algibacter lectus]GAL81968.1 hypothetical protein JCM19274_148 [Algibacter lectus]